MVNNEKFLNTSKIDKINKNTYFFNVIKVGIYHEDKYFKIYLIVF